ncbi:hypothetical protein BH23CHL2_BH23CHL2_04380 [soil metagenome]
MPRFVIERNILNAGKLTQEELQAISQKSNSVLGDLTSDGNSIQWVQSYVTDDAIHCVYVASDADIIREHARCGGFPADRVLEVQAVIDPTAAE